VPDNEPKRRAGRMKARLIGVLDIRLQLFLIGQVCHNPDVVDTDLNGRVHLAGLRIERQMQRIPGLEEKVAVLVAEVRGHWWGWDNHFAPALPVDVDWLGCEQV